MLLIECPWCGPRGEHEFTCGGEGHIARPSVSCSDDAWSNYLFFRKNSKGEHFERWRHTHGCRLWFNVARDTRTHEIRAVYKMGEPPPEPSS
jgi:heterotetrameric sarcosine oxidase delta subunit